MVNNLGCDGENGCVVFCGVVSSVPCSDGVSGVCLAGVVWCGGDWRLVISCRCSLCLVFSFCSVYSPTNWNICLRLFPFSLASSLGFQYNLCFLFLFPVLCTLTLRFLYFLSFQFFTLKNSILPTFVSLSVVYSFMLRYCMHWQSCNRTRLIFPSLMLLFVSTTRLSMERETVL